MLRRRHRLTFKSVQARQKLSLHASKPSCAGALRASVRTSWSSDGNSPVGRPTTDAGHDSGRWGRGPFEAFPIPRLLAAQPSPSGGRRGPTKDREQHPCARSEAGVEGVSFGLGCNVRRGADRNGGFERAPSRACRERMRRLTVDTPCPSVIAAEELSCTYRMKVSSSSLSLVLLPAGTGNIVRGGGYGLIGDLIVAVIGAFIEGLKWTPFLGPWVKLETGRSV